MEQTPSQDKNQGFWQKNKSYLVGIGIIVIVAIAFLATQNQGEPGEEEVVGENTNASAEQMTEESGIEQGEATEEQDLTGQAADAMESKSAMLEGNVTATGVLQASDDSGKGNLMIDSEKGKVYIQTRRDFSSLLGQEVTLDAEGSIESFIFLGFLETPATGGPADEEADATEEPDVAGTVSASGTLEISDDLSRGNYLIVSDSLKIYLQSVRDYTAWYGQEVELTATGSIESFTSAVLTKK